MKKILVALISLSLCFISCSNKKQTQVGTSAFQSEKRITIGYSIDTLAIERWRRDCDVFLNTAKELNADVIVQNAGNSIEGQIKQIEYLITRKVDVIVIVAKKDDSLTDVIKLARSKGIPVIAYDRLIRNADISLYMTIDSSLVGELMAKELIKQKAFGTWYCIYGSKEDYNMEMINNGIKRVIAGSPVKIGYIYYTPGWNYDLSYKEMTRLLKDGKIPDVVISGNDAVANSVIQAISEICPNEEITIAGQDADIAGCQNVVNGKQLVTIYKPITQLAEQAARCAVKLSQGQTPEELGMTTQVINNGYADIPVVYLTPTAVTKDNIDEVVIKIGRAHV